MKKKRSGIATPNRHLFLLLFIFTFNLRSIQEHYQQCSILKNLDVVQCFQHEVRIHLRQRLCPIGIFYELLRPITFQEVLALHLFRPLLHEILSVLHQCIPSHQISLYQRFFLHMAVSTSHDSFDLVPFTALPYLTVNARAAPPAFPCKNLIAVSTNYLRCKWIAFRPVGIGVCSMLLKVFFSALNLKLNTFPYSLRNDSIVVILYIKHLDFSFVRCPLFGKKIHCIAFLQQCIPFVLFIFQHAH